MNYPPNNDRPDIGEIIKSGKGKVPEWLNRANKYIKLYLNGNSKLMKAEDIIGDILLKIENGERKWDHEKVDINAFMFNTIRSHIDGIAKKERRTESIDRYNEENGTFETKNDIENYISLEIIEYHQDLRERLEIVRGAIKNDDDCELIFECKMQRMKNDEIAEDLGISKQEVINIIKRIKYKVMKGINQQNN